ncbi:MAG: response regulator transcription factor [Spirochaetaceae bacterium]|jgi:DNA-binding response OmpR family regulator|nr:response regulator transcription factor [Spirochaetaceae bacterium]
MVTILVVEDDEKLNRIVCACLDEHGYKAIGCSQAMRAFDRMTDTIVDLIISDVMLPKVDGFKFAAMVREQDARIPILFVTARDDIASKEKGFRIGIDDYMTKPVDMDELILRVGALLRRANIANEKKITAGSLVLNADEMTAAVAEEEVPVTVREFNVLWKLLSYPKKTFTRNQLMDHFWGMESESSPRTVDVYITKLREKFAFCGDFEIVTVHGLGYKAVLK